MDYWLTLLSGIAIGLSVFFLLAVGASIGKDDFTEKCDLLGKFSRDDVVYTCAREAHP